MLGNTRQLVARLANRQNSATRVLAMSQTKVLAVPIGGMETRQSSSHHMKLGQQVFDHHVCFYSISPF